MSTGSSNQMEALQHVNESAAQWKACRCGDGDGSHWPARSDSHDRHVRCRNCQNLQVFKSGPLFISSKGLGWTSWKKRWFILTRASLVFFRSDPNAPAQKGSEVNLTLGGIELNNSGSVVVRADKKLLTVLFPDGRDGRAFTLKAETSEDMHEWKIALEHALSQAPSASLVLGVQSSILHNEVAETIEGSLDKSGKGSKRTTKSTVIGRPVLLALEDTDGNPSFLEKAVKFIEDYGMKVEGILRQSADVEEVERRIEEYEHGKNEFSSNEDAHVIGDCIKYVLRELPSSPVPASCCTALLEAFRGDRGTRVSSMRTVIYDTFPQPNRRLLQRMLKMMRIVASHKTENRMSVSAIAACMAPLLLRPLLAGDCELEDEFDMGGDGSIQLLQAAAAANHAQAIVIILLEQYDRIFTDDHLQEDAFSSELYSESECSEEDDDYEDDDEDEDEYEDEESTDSEVQQHNGYHKAESDKKPGTVNGSRNAYSEARDESTSDLSSDLYDNKVIDSNYSDILLPKTMDSEANCRLPDLVAHDSLSRHHNYQRTADDAESKLSQDNGNNLYQRKSPSAKESDSHGSLDGIHTSGSLAPKTVDQNPASCNKAKEFIPNSKKPAVWGRTAARKNLSLEAIDYLADDETAVKRLETAKSDLQNKLNREVKENEQLQGSLERRKEALRDRRLALQQDVERLQGQLQKERALRASLEAGLISATPGLPISSALIDNKTRKDLEDIALTEADIISLKQNVSDLQGQLKQDQQISSSRRESIGHYHHSDHQSKRNEGCEDVSIVADPRQREHSRNTEDVFSATTSMDENSQGPDAMSFPTNQPSLAWSSSSSTNESSSNESNAYNHQTNSKLEQKQPLRRQLHNVRGTESSRPAVYNLSQDGPADGASGISRKSSSRGEELLPPSSSALTRLTNRLNFLKERRVQLVNELQAVDGNHSRGSKCPPPRTNSR